MSINLSSLNPEQLDAATYTRGAVLVLAGAGSGKTSVLTYRIARLIEDEGAPPSSIMAITFTNKAAREMRQRVSALCPGSSDVWVSTFHAACARILRRDAEKLGYTRAFTIFDEDDQLSLIKHILKDMDLSTETYPPREMRYIISRSKNDMIDADELFAQSKRDLKAQRVSSIYTEYDKRLLEQNAMDFDDLLLKTLTLLTDHPPVLSYYQRRFDYIMVDEAQDVNATQYHMVRLLAGPKRNLFLVGDDDQSIYAWRGADISIILGFERDYPECRVIKLEQNYRSTGTILDAANAVIKNNIERKQKTLWSARSKGDKLTLASLPNERAEAQYIMGRIGAHMKAGVSLRDMAILYRLNAQSRVPEEQLLLAGLKYRVYGGLKFYDRKEVKDIVAYLRVIGNPLDEAGLLRIINTPRRGIGDSTVERLRSIARGSGMSLFALLLNIDESGGLNARAVSSVKKFAGMMACFIAMKDIINPSELLDSILEQTGYMESLISENTEESEARIQNVKEFKTAVEEYVKDAEAPTLTEFLESVALVSDTDSGEDVTDAVSLMTLHSAKGLEFPIVFILGCEEGIFPHARALLSEPQMEEERRLFYVGVTRAKDSLYITHTSERTFMGKTQHNTPARFLSELPEELVERVSRKNERETLPSLMPSFRRPHSPPKAAAGEYAVGGRLEHAEFGAGTIITAKQENGDHLLKVAFPGRGIKVLLASELRK